MGLGENNPPRVFLSHTSEFRNYPSDCSYLAAVESAVSAAGLVIVDMRQFAASDAAPAQVCQKKVRGCEVYLGIFGTRYGSPVRERPEVSYTELEFDTASEPDHPLERLVFLLDEEAENPGIPAKWLNDPIHGERQQAFLRKVKDAGLTLQTFRNPDELARLVERSLVEWKQHHQARQVALKPQDVPGEGWSALRIQLTLEEIRDKLFETIPSNATDQAHEQAHSKRDLHQGLTPTAEILTSTFNDIESCSRGSPVSGIPVNFYDLDAITQGLQRSDLIIVAGRPAMGKTSFVLDIAKNVAQLHQLPVAVFSLEMSKEQLNYRLLSMEAGIESGRLRTGRLQPEEWPLLGNAISSLSQLPLFLDDKPNAGVLEMRTICRRLIAETGNELGLVIIDYLQLMEGLTPDNREQEISRITWGLKGMARELNVPVIAMSQLSPGVEARTNKRPMLSDLRESGSIEQDADLVLMIYRDEYYNPDTADRGITEVIVTKHRNGPVGTVKLLFEPQFTRFRNLEVP